MMLMTLNADKIAIRHSSQLASGSRRVSGTISIGAVLPNQTRESAHEIAPGRYLAENCVGLFAIVGQMAARTGQRGKLSPWPPPSDPGTKR